MNFYCCIKKNQSGRFTLEAAIIMPVLIFIVSAFAYVGLYLYQRVTIQACAKQAADRASSSWFGNPIEFEAGSAGSKTQGGLKLYRRIFDSDKAEKKEEAALLAGRLLKKRSILKPTYESIRVFVEDGFLTKKIIVQIECNYPLPLRIAGLFGGGKGVAFKSEAVSIVKEPAELIRNTDFLIEFEKDLEKEFPGIREFRQKLTESINKVVESISP